MGYVIVAVIAVLVAVFAMQNTASVDLRFLFWRLAAVPLAAVVLASLAAGIVVAGLPMWFRVWRLRRQLRRAGAVPPPAASSRPAPPPPPDVSKTGH
jgi:uncharacterized integral membrane protein